MQSILITGRSPKLRSRSDLITNAKHSNNIFKRRNQSCHIPNFTKFVITMNKGIIIEVCANSLESALIAQKEGADRIELCQSLNEGGLTPSAGTLKAVREALSIEVHVLIRPRAGDFNYSQKELSEIKADIIYAKELGIDGVVIGILDLDGNIDKAACTDLINRARPMTLTFHRAFDMCKDPIKALNDIIELGFDRLLTSGQQNKAIEGIELIKELVDIADNRIAIMAGSGINADNIQQIIAETAVKNCHVSASSHLKSRMKFQKEGIEMGGIKNYPEFEKRSTDPIKLRTIIKAVKE